MLTGIQFGLSIVWKKLDDDEFRYFGRSAEKRNWSVIAQ